MKALKRLVVGSKVFLKVKDDNDRKYYVSMDLDSESRSIELQEVDEPSNIPSSIKSGAIQSIRSMCSGVVFEAADDSIVVLHKPYGTLEVTETQYLNPLHLNVQHNYKLLAYPLISGDEKVEPCMHRLRQNMYQMLRGKIESMGNHINKLQSAYNLFVTRQVEYSNEIEMEDLTGRASMVDNMLLNMIEATEASELITGSIEILRSEFV